MGNARLFYHLEIALITVLLISSFRVGAQGLPGQDTPPMERETSRGSVVRGSGSDELEDLYDKDDQKTSETPKTESKPVKEHKSSPDVQSLSDLAKLAPFSDVAVIQRRFLPKTHRFEFSLGAFTNLNNPFFTSYGAGGSIAYYLREQWALEGIGNFSASGSREVTDNLRSKRQIATTNLVTATSFFGAALKWNPIYGKITWLNKSIVPFDLNFSLGGGMTQTTDNQSVGTLHFGTSQVFALSKAMAVRWDFAWNYYNANATDDTAKKVKISQSDLYLGLGISFYFPEASYR